MSDTPTIGHNNPPEPVNPYEIPPEKLYYDGLLEQVIAQIEAEIASFNPITSSKKGLDEIRSKATNLRSLKVHLDDAGKSLTEDMKAKTSAIDKMRREMRDRMDELAVAVRKPLTEYEDAEKAREAALVAAFADLKSLNMFTGTVTSEEIMKRLQRLDELSNHNWEKHAADATETIKSMSQTLNDLLRDTKIREQEMVELERLRKERLEQEKKEADRLAAEERQREIAKAAEQTRQEAEKAARKEIEQAEQQRKAAEQRALDAEARAKREAEEAAARERLRIADEEAKKKADEERREANKRHVAKINNAAMGALVRVLNGVDAQSTAEEMAKAIVIAIAKDEIPSVSIKY